MSARPGDRVVPAVLISLLAVLLFDLMGLVIKHLSDRYGAAELSAWAQPLRAPARPDRACLDAQVA
jgi:hypothetical protein